MESSLCEKPERHAPRRLSDHLMLDGQKQKVHSLVDKVYSRENLKLAWERVRANQGASGADRITIEDFEAGLGENLDRLHRDLREQTYQPQAVRRLEIPKRGAPGKTKQEFADWPTDADGFITELGAASPRQKSTRVADLRIDVRSHSLVDQRISA